MNPVRKLLLMYIIKPWTYIITVITRPPARPAERCEAGEADLWLTNRVAPGDLPKSRLRRDGGQGRLYTLLLMIIFLAVAIPWSNLIKADPDPGDTIELKEQRTKNSKTFRKPDGNYIWEGSLGAIHYQDQKGTWEEIDTTLVPMSSEERVANSEYAWQMTRADYQLYCKKNFGAGKIIKFAKGEHYVRFQPGPLRYVTEGAMSDPLYQEGVGGVLHTPKSPLIRGDFWNQLGTKLISKPSPQARVQVKDNQITYLNAYGEGIDLIWQARNTSLLKLLTIKDRSSLPIYHRDTKPLTHPSPHRGEDQGEGTISSEYSTVFLELNLVFDYSEEIVPYISGIPWDEIPQEPEGTVEFKDGYNKTLWGFMPLWAWDSNPNQPPIRIIQRLHKIGPPHPTRQGESPLETSPLPPVARLALSGGGGPACQSETAGREEKGEGEMIGDELVVSIRVPLAWLQDPARVYPVFIDTVVDETVPANADDGRYTSGMIPSWSNNGTTIGVNKNFLGFISSVARFTTVDIPKDATIDVAYLTLRASGSAVLTVNSKLAAHDAGDSDQISDGADFTGRDRTAKVDWDISTWTSGNDYNSPSIIGPIQTVINHGAWASGNALTIFWENDDSADNKSVYATSRDGSATLCPRLHIEYSPETIWTGADAVDPHDWNDADNWDNGLPDSTVNAIIPGEDYGSPEEPLIDMTLPGGGPGSNDYCLGYQFTPQVDGRITALGRYIGSGTGNTQIGLWNDPTGTLLGSVDLGADDGTDWKWKDLGSPVDVSSGQPYRVAVLCAGGGDPGFWYQPYAGTYGNIQVIQGCYIGGTSLVYPNLTDAGNIYGYPDIRFEPGSAIDPWVITMTAAANCKNLTLSGAEVTLQSDNIDYGLTISGTLAITNTGSLLVVASATTITCKGDVLVGSTTTAGALELQPNTKLLFTDDTITYGLIVDAYGTLTATGTSSASRDCKIASIDTTNRGYIYLKAGSETFLQYCEMAYLGTLAATKYGLSAYSVDGNNANEGLTVDDCYIHHNYNGIYLSGASNNTISETTCSTNTNSGIYVYNNANNNTLTGNNCYDNSSRGIYLNASTGCTLTNNACYNTEGGAQDYGFYLSSNASANILDGNDCYNNTVYGICFSGTDDCTLTNNTCSTNTQNGICLAASANDNTLEDNKCYDNGSGGIYAGIYLNSSTGCTLTNNSCYNSSGIAQNSGIYLNTSANNNTLDGNYCYNNGDQGIYLDSSTGCTLTNNSCFNSPGTTDQDYGIYLITNANNNTLNDNDCYDNNSTGIDISLSTGCTLTNNSCFNNSDITDQDYGIQLNNAATHTLNGNTCSTNTLHGIYLSNSCYNISLSDENYYGNSRTGLYGTGVNSPVVDCVFGSISGTSQASANTYGDICDVGTLICQNCLLDSSIEVSVTGTANVLSQCHDQTAGLTRIFGSYEHASGTLQWSYADESYSGAGDQDLRKQVEVADSFEATGGTLEMIGSSVSSTLISNYGAVSYTFKVSDGSIKAAHYKFLSLGADGLYITGTATIASTAYGTGLNYGTFKNTKATGTHIKIGLLESRVISGCVFDDSPTYNVWVDIGSNIITMTNCWLPNSPYDPEAKDAEDPDGPSGTSGFVVWTNETTTVMWTTQGHFEGTEEAVNANYLSATIRTDVDTATTTDSVLLGEGFIWVQKSPATDPPERYGHALAYDSARDRTVLFGGFDSTGRRNDTWEWNGSDWTQKCGTITPTARYYHDMVYDSANNRTILFGGDDAGGYKNDLWEWDGNNWTQKAGTITPTARAQHGLTYDSARNRTVLFGGTDGSAKNDLWEWDGNNWTQKADTVTPTARTRHGLAYDTTRAKTVLFGGTGPKNDTWEWDGTNWIQVAGTTTPTACDRLGLAYITATNTTAGKIVLFGGYSTTYLNDTWEWNGFDWIQIYGPSTPSLRYSHSMAYDVAQEEVVMFGGYYSGSYLDETWVYTREPGRYEYSGTIRNLKVNAVNAADWGIISWNADTPTNTTIKCRTRGADSEADLASASWSDYYTTAGEAITTSNSKWLEVEVTLLTTDSSTCPQLDDLQVTYEIPTVVNLVEFKALGLFEEVLVKWTTATEFENAGFNLYRNTVPDNEGWIKLNQSLIPGLGNSLDGKAYHFTDYNVEDGTTYYYWLEDVDFNGNTYIHGPVAAHPGLDSDGDGMTDDWEIYYGLDPYRNDADEDPDGDGFTNLEEFRMGTDPFSSDSEITSGGDGSVFDLINPWTIWADEFAGPSADEAGSSGEIEEGLRIISSDETGIVLEMITARFTAVPRDLDGEPYQMLELPGYIHGYTDETGKAQLPIKPVLLGIPYNIDCTIEDIEISTDFISPTGYHIYPVPGFGEDDQGKTFDPLNPPDEPDNPAVIPDPNFYTSDLDYPGQAVELVAVTSLRGQGIACINLCPLNYNPAHARLQLNYRIRFKLVFGTTREVSPPPDEPPVILPPTVPELKIAITETGVYRLGYNAIWNAGFQDINWLDPHELKLYYHGQEIPIRVIGEADNQFDITDSIEFYAVSNPTKYSPSSIYWLTYSEGQGLRIAEYSSVSGTAVVTPTAFSTVVHLEENDIYWRKRTGSETTDRWLWNNPSGGITDTSQANYEIYLPDLTPLVIPVSVTLKAAYYGFYDITPHPNHHTKVYINGYLVDDAYWDGKIEYISDISITQPALLTNGNNTITLETLLDTGAEHDLILPNYFEVEYWRDSKALSNTLQFSYTGNDITQFIVSGYTQPAIEVWNITDPLSPTYVTATEISELGGLYTVAFKDTIITGVPASYIILTTDTMKSPAGLVLDEASYLTLATNKADYLMITHSDFKDSIEPLADLHRSRGLTVEVVDIIDIYDEFNYGEASPYALKDFLKHAYESWQRPAPTYVLLAGDASYDYHNYLGYGNHNYIPTYLVPDTDFFGETGSDNWLVCLDGDTDFLPDMFIGRIPVRTPIQLDGVVDKLIVYARNPLAEWNKNIILAADNEDGFKDHSDLLVPYLSPVLKSITPRYKDYYRKRFIPQGEQINYLLSNLTKLYLGNWNCPDEVSFKTQLIDGINNGVLWINYIGHGWSQGWLQSPNTFNPVTLGWTNPDRYPFIASLTCLDGYYLEPEPGDECIAEELLNMVSSGSIGAWSATGMGLPSGHAVLNEELVRIIFEEEDRRFGAATTRAKLNLFARAGTQYQDLIETYHLFGDPALSLKCKTSRRIITYLAKALGRWDGGRAFNQIADDARNRPKGFEAICAETLLNYETAKDWRDQHKNQSAPIPENQDEDENE